MSARLTSTLQSLCKTFNVAPATSARATVAELLNQEALFKLPDLKYDYGALEPTIIGEIMELHHSKHHQTYINNLKVRAAPWPAPGGGAGPPALECSRPDAVPPGLLRRSRRWRTG